MVRLPSGAGYWTVLDEELSVVPFADAFLRHLRFGRDGAESTTKAYAGAIALFLRWCARTGRDWQGGAEQLGLFMVWLAHAGPPASGIDAGSGAAVLAGPGSPPRRFTRTRTLPGCAPQSMRCPARVRRQETRHEHSDGAGAAARHERGTGIQSRAGRGAAGRRSCAAGRGAGPGVPGRGRLGPGSPGTVHARRAPAARPGDLQAQRVRGRASRRKGRRVLPLPDPAEAGWHDRGTDQAGRAAAPGAGPDDAVRGAGMPARAGIGAR
jgi:hypothetical protein